MVGWVPGGKRSEAESFWSPFPGAGWEPVEIFPPGPGKPTQKRGLYITGIGGFR